METEKTSPEEELEGAAVTEEHTEERPSPASDNAGESEAPTAEAEAGAGAPVAESIAESEVAAAEIETGPDADKSVTESAAEPEVATAEIEAPPDAEESASQAEEEAEAATEQSEAEAEGEDDGQEEEQEQEVERPEGTAWYVIHSYSGYENKVRQNLLQRIESMDMGNLIFNVIVPTEEEVEIRDGHRRTYKKRVFPGYILVEMLLTEESWYVVRNTPGVTGFVGSGNQPTPLQDEEVDKIIKRMEVETPKIKVGFREGQTVRITDGPFVDFMGTVDELFLDRGKVRVLVSMFGRETPVELDFLQVEKI